MTTESEGGDEAKEGMFPGIEAAGRGLLEVPYNSNLCHYDTASLKLQCHCGKNVPCSGLLERDDVVVSHTEIFFIMPSVLYESRRDAHSHYDLIHSV